MFFFPWNLFENVKPCTFLVFLKNLWSIKIYWNVASSFENYFKICFFDLIFASRRHNSEVMSLFHIKLIFLQFCTWTFWTDTFFTWLLLLLSKFLKLVLVLKIFTTWILFLQSNPKLKIYNLSVILLWTVFQKYRCWAPTFSCSWLGQNFHCGTAQIQTFHFHTRLLCILLHSIYFYWDNAHWSTSCKCAIVSQRLIFNCCILARC